MTVTGEFDYANEVHVTPRPPPKDVPSGLIPPTATGGFLAITPLVRPDGSRVLVHRGWVPHAGSGSAGGKGQQAREEGGGSPVAFHPAAGPAGRVTVTGVLREGEDVSGGRAGGRTAGLGWVASGGGGRPSAHARRPVCSALAHAHSALGHPDRPFYSSTTHPHPTHPPPPPTSIRPCDPLSRACGP